MSSPATSAEHFDEVAARYDELRPLDDGWWGVYDALVEAADLRGRRVLEVGCGTGRLAEALAERELARVWAVDASPAMAAAARSRGVTVKVASAERLPFRDGWFERVLMRMVLHLLDAPAALAEARRVLGRDGRLALATLDPSWFGEHWLAPWFPSIPRIDADRFPDEARLRALLERAGFEVAIARVEQPASLTRERALATMRGRAFSTFRLIPEDEYREGLARAEAELPDRLDYVRRWLVATGTTR